MYKWYLPTLSEIVALSEPDQMSWSGSLAHQQVKVERQWGAAIAALNCLLHERLTGSDLHLSNNGAKPSVQGIVLSGASPVLDQPELVAGFSTWTFTADPLHTASWLPVQLLPSAEQHSVCDRLTASTLPLLPDDPLGIEQFCLVLTSDFCLVLSLGTNLEGNPTFLFSFVPEVIWQGWRALRSRLQLTSPHFLATLDRLVEQFNPVAPDYRIVTQFSRLMLAHLSDVASRSADGEHLPSPLEGVERGYSTEPIQSQSSRGNGNWHQGVAQNLANTASKNGRKEDPLEQLTQGKPDSDVELLQAIAHEVRTPLTTIRTLTRSLLKRKDLTPDVVKRLNLIDQECTEQIDRFSLIFRAVELETTAIKQPVAPAAISLAQVFEQSVPRWQQQASQRNLTLEVVLPQKLPMVLADPSMLEQVLTGLIDRITNTSPMGSHIQLRVKLAGHQLKLQFQARPQPEAEQDGKPCGKPGFAPPLKSLGGLLMFQPETGGLSLNLAVTKNLFQALGGKLIVRQRPQQAEELTIFLPLETRKEDGSHYPFHNPRSS